MIRLLLVFFILLTACGTTNTPTQTATLDGYDSASGTTLQTINIWRNYTDRNQGLAGKGTHGEAVQLIRREGDGVLIQTSAGVRGWVNYRFIRELK